jgi:hypothetical protein
MEIRLRILELIFVIVSFILVGTLLTLASTSVITFWKASPYLLAIVLFNSILFIKRKYKLSKRLWS